MKCKLKSPAGYWKIMMTCCYLGT